METRRYKNSNELISLLGFGCMRLPLKENKNEIDKEKAQEMVDYAISHGINYFDTAYMYHEGQSESFIGEALSKHHRNSFNLATKMPLAFVSSEADVERIFREQLQKCRVDYFDYYLLHNINEKNLRKVESYKIYEIIKEKQRQGKIRRLGFSFHDRPELLAEVVEKYDWDFAQIQLNYMDWELQDAERQYQILKDNEIPIIVMEPIRGGSLATLSEKSVELFKNANPQASIASWALRYAASLPQVLVVLSGMSNLAQMQDNIQTIDRFKPLEKNEYAVIEKALATYRISATIPCTACRYCMDCPSGVDIPRILAIYNNYLVRKSQANPMSALLFDMDSMILGEENQSHHCVKCNQCADHCPQQIDIPRWMDIITTFSEERKTNA
jgi:predicted aldo/keto reductase-like oxidoreductase